MAPHLVDTNDRTFPCNRLPKVTFTYCHSFFHSRRSKVFPALHIMMNLTKDPGIPDSSTTDHNTVYPIPVPVFHRFLRTVNISITKDRDLYTRIIFDFRNKRPVCFALVHLAPRSSMDGKRFDAHVL